MYKDSEQQWPSQTLIPVQTRKNTGKQKHIHSLQFNEYNLSHRVGRQQSSSLRAEEGGKHVSYSSED